jgi:glucose-6-phosphate 1-dehydrogenase
MDANRSGGANGSEPCTVVLFGASGDLAKRKVIPAMFDLASHSSLGPRYAIVGFARTPMNDESFRASIPKNGRSSRRTFTTRRESTVSPKISRISRSA